MLRLLKELRPKAYARRLIVRLAQGRVVAGPFVGMRYARDAGGRVGYSYLLGTHECELRDIWEELCQTPFNTMINVGAAEGYYVIGFARRVADCKAIAFEMDPKAQQVFRELAAMNGVAERIELHGLCDAPGLVRSLENSGRTLVVMDVEGAEAILLDPLVAPRLREATVLVEVHDFVYRGMGDLLRARFAATHDIVEVWSRARTLADFPLPLPAWKMQLLRRSLLQIISERRCEKMRWFYLKPKTPGATA